MRRNRRLLLLGLSPQSFLPIQPLSHPIVMGRLFSLPQHLFPQLLPLLPLFCLHHLFKTLLRAFLFFISLFILFWTLPLLPFLVPLLTLILCLLLLLLPASSSSCILTSPLPSSLPPPYSVYRPLPIYASSRPSSFSMGSIPHLYSSVLSTNTLSLSYHGSPSTRVSSASSGPVPSGPKKRATRS